MGTATRERVCLNEIWRFRPEGRDSWLYLPVPGSWDPSDRFVVRGADGSPQRKGLRGVKTAWYEREFSLPSDWHGQRIVLGIDSVRAVGEVWLNGRHLGRALEFQRSEFDVSRVAKSGANILQVHVRVLSPKSLVRGLDEDVWIERRPTGPAIEWVDLRPQVAAARMAVRARITEPAAGAQLHVALTDLAGRPVGHGSGPAQAGVTAVDLATPQLQPWHPDSPRLYLATVSLRRRGRVLDERYPIRFGHRQMQVRGGDFLLNGRKFHVRGQAAPPFGRLEFNTVEPAIREWVGQMRGMHVNAVREYSRGWSSGQGWQWRELYYDIADEMGLIVLAHVPSNRALAHAEFRTPPLPELYQARVADFVHRYGNHACAAMWYLNFNHGAHVGDIRPDLIDGSFDPVGLPQKRWAHEWMSHSEAVLNRVDGGRPVFHHSAGNFGQVLTVMAYLGFGIPLQEREEWPSAWAKTRFKPLMPVETGFPCLLSNYRERKGSLDRVYASEQLTPEYFAAYAGDRVYQSLTEDEVRLMNPGQSNGTRMAAMKRSINYDEQKALFARWTLRSWRTFDVSGYCQHVEWRDCYTYEPKPIKLPARDPRHFGPRTDRDEVHVQTRATVTRLGRVALRENAPLLAYVAGPRSAWPDKAHGFYTGETVERSAVLINDTPKPLTFTGTLVATLAGRECLRRALREPVAVGERVFVPIRFTAPAVAVRQSGAITLSVQAAGRRLPGDAFQWECFPRPERPAVAAHTALLDSVGDTARVLRQAGVASQSHLGPDIKLLVIGRKALDEEARERLAAWDVMAKVEAGLNVLVFEQAGEHLAGMPMDDPNCRAAFVRAPSHPVLAGLSSADMCHWSGQSDMTEPYPKSPRDNLTWGEEFMRWGNRGVVCSFAPEKPQRGVFTVLVDAEFDLYLAPLLEWSVGRGRIVFCQLDVTPRYGRGPVPTLLVNRLLAYLSTPAAAPVPTAVALRGGAQTAALARTLSASAADDSAVVLVGPDWQGDPQKLAGLARAGCRVVIVACRDRVESIFDGSIHEREVFKVSVPPGLERRGVAPGDFFWRELRRVPVLTSVAPDVVHTDPAVVAQRGIGAGEIIWCGVGPTSFSDPRQVAKTLRLIALLLRSGAARPDLAAARSTAGEPGSPLAGPGLGFNPYKYRRW